MQNLNWTSFTRKITINATMKTVYDAWATASSLEKWFLKKAVFINNKGVTQEPAHPAIQGDLYDWSWYAFTETEQGVVLMANGQDQFQFTFAGDCKVTVMLQPLDEAVLVTLNPGQHSNG